MRPVSEFPALVPEKPTCPSGALFLPYLSGERTPNNAPFAKAGFFDLTRRTTMPDMVQAVMEGVAFSFADCKRVLEAAGTQIDHVYLDGGGGRSDAWLNIMASARGLTLLKPEDGDAGAALGPHALEWPQRKSGRTMRQALMVLHSMTTLAVIRKPRPLR